MNKETEKKDKEKVLFSEHQYLNLLRDILEKGNRRSDRTNVGTLSLFGKQMVFDISEHIPLLTTKKMAWKTLIRELLWFLSGSTNSRVLEDQGVHIWSGNTSRQFLDERRLNHYNEGDIGPLYPFSFRHYGATYKGCDKSYKGEGYDQWTHLIQGLKKDPFSRRHLMTTYNPSVVDQCVLPPCHGIAIQFYVEPLTDLPDSKKFGLKCHVYCRSSDVFLGLPFNIASYCVLTYIVATLCDMKPLELIMSLGDSHIYMNHVDQVKEQLTRQPYIPPTLKIKESIKEKDISEVILSDFELIDYVHHAPIKADMAI